MRCMNCGWDNHSNTTVCLKCGQPLRMPENYANSQDIFNVKKELYFVGFYFKHAIFIPLHASSSVISLKAGRG